MKQDIEHGKIAKIIERSASKLLSLTDQKMKKFSIFKNSPQELKIKILMK